LSFGADGTLYLAALTMYGRESALVFPGPLGVEVSRSTDGGDTWSAPAFVTNLVEEVVNDKESITAHPRRAGTVYATWSKRDAELLGAVAYSRSTDSAQTWSSQTIAYLAPPALTPVSANVQVLDDDSLLILFTQFPVTDSPSNPFPPAGTMIDIMAVRSTDGGAHWSAPTRIGSTPFAWVRDPEPLTDPNNPGLGSPVASGLPHIINGAVGPDGTVYVSWPETTQQAGTIRVARSSDRGSTWQVETAAQINAAVFFGTIAVSPDGGVAILFSDLRNDRLGDGPLTTDLWLRRSRDRGATWEESHLASYDLRQSYNEIVGGYWVGDYQSLAAVGPHDFAALFGMPVNRQAQVYFASSAPPPK
jgi:hypothetical protein